jgi:hypothetical protein
MNLGTFLQTIITIVFIYLILALLASELQENIAGILKLRAIRLKASIAKMFGENENTSADTLVNKLTAYIQNILVDKTKSDAKNTLLTNKLYDHSIIKALYINNIGPSSIEPKTFATVIVSIIQELDIESLQALKIKQDPILLSVSQSKDFLKQKQDLLIEESNKTPVVDLDIKNLKTEILKLEKEISESEEKISESDLQFKKEKEQYRKIVYPSNYPSNLSNLSSLSSTEWAKVQDNLERQFAEVQERSTGVYKRKAKVWSVIIGFLVAIIANADAFNIITNLSKANQNYGDNLIKKIEEKSPQLFPAGATGGKELTSEQRSLISTIVDETGILPLGWDFDLEMEKDNYKKKSKLIELLNNNKPKIELLSKNQGECEGEERKNKCFDDLYNQIELSKEEVFSFLGSDFINKFNDRDRENFPKAYTSLLEKLKKEQSLKILKPIGSEDNLNLNIQKQGGWVQSILGWVISAIAISMGAPFWFDLLGNIMNVRNSGRDLKRKRN